MMATKGWKVVQAHVPMIRFRKGGTVGVGKAAAAAIPLTSPGLNPRGAPTKLHVIALPVIEDFQLPFKFQRRSIDSKEIDYINRGGPE